MPTDSIAPASPIIDLPLFSVGDGFEAQLEVADLTKAPRVRMVDPVTGDTHVISMEALEHLRNVLSGLVNSVRNVQEMRLVHAHPALSPVLMHTIRQAEPRFFHNGGQQELRLGAVLMAAREGGEPWGESPRDGEPTLLWTVGTPEGDECGWHLVLHGGTGTSLGFAAWNDEAGIERLVGALADRQSAFVLAGVMDSASTARLSSRLSALSLRQARRLPAIRLKTVREVLDAAGMLGTPGGNTHGRGRVLSIEVDDKAVPVAVAILPPQRPVMCVPFPDDFNEKTWNERQQITQTIETAGRALWLDQARAALAEAGWREVSLPYPLNFYQSWRVAHTRNTQDAQYLYVTRIKEELWGDIHAAAQQAAEGLNLNRCSVL